MIEDPIVEEVHRTRERLLAKYCGMEEKQEGQTFVFLLRVTY